MKLHLVHCTFQNLGSSFASQEPLTCLAIQFEIKNENEIESIFLLFRVIHSIFPPLD